MSWRTVVITSRCKLDYKMGYMVIRGEDTKRIFLDEIAILLLENPAVSLTGCLLEALVEKKIKVIFCGTKRIPIGELTPYQGSYDSSRKIKQQIAWKQEMKDVIWSMIVAEKIDKQADFLQELGKERETEMLRSYRDQIVPPDLSNREGHAAKVYFNAVFGMDFTRDTENAANAALNYGYSILAAAFSREIVACGYLTQLGLFHDNVFNHFNLSSDLMEPFRILVDRAVVASGCDVFTTESKQRLLAVLNQSVRIGETVQTVLQAIRIYVHSVFEALHTEDPLRVQFYRMES